MCNVRPCGHCGINAGSNSLLICMRFLRSCLYAVIFDKFTSWKRKWGVGLGCIVFRSSSRSLSISASKRSCGRNRRSFISNSCRRFNPVSVSSPTAGHILSKISYAHLGLWQLDRLWGQAQHFWVSTLEFCNQSCKMQHILEPASFWRSILWFYDNWSRYRENRGDDNVNFKSFKSCIVFRGLSCWNTRCLVHNTYKSSISKNILCQSWKVS